MPIFHKSNIKNPFHKITLPSIRPRHPHPILLPPENQQNTPSQKFPQKSSPTKEITIAPAPAAAEQASAITAEHSKPHQRRAERAPSAARRASAISGKKSESHRRREEREPSAPRRASAIGAKQSERHRRQAEREASAARRARAIGAKQSKHQCH